MEKCFINLKDTSYIEQNDTLTRELQRKWSETRRLIIENKGNLEKVINKRSGAPARSYGTRN